MSTQTITGLTFNQVTDSDLDLLKDVMVCIAEHPEKMNVLFGDESTPEVVLESYIKHIGTYGTGLGFVKNEEGVVIGMGGLQFINDVQLFELVCCMLPEYEHQGYDATDMLRYNAFEKMSLDKVCARANAGSLQGLVYRENGFVYIDERAFTTDSMTHIWDYYELENDANTITVSDIFTNWHHMEA